MISSAIITAVSGYLAEAGFTVKPEYTDDVEARPAVQSGAVYPAFICVKKTELCELGITGTDSRRCTAEVTLRVRALGSSPGFGGAETLSGMTESAAEMIYFSSEMIVKSIALGEMRRNMALGRLEQIMEMTLVTEADWEVTE